MKKYAGLSARDFYPNFNNEATDDTLVPAEDQQQSLSGSDTIAPVVSHSTILLWLGVFAAIAVVLHFK